MFIFNGGCISGECCCGGSHLLQAAGQACVLVGLVAVVAMRPGVGTVLGRRLEVIRGGVGGGLAALGGGGLVHVQELLQHILPDPR